MERTGVILAAGFGSRLAGVHERTRLEPLTPVAGVPLLQRRLRSLERAGCGHIVIVVGHAGNEVKAAAERVHDGQAELVFAHDERYELANGNASLSEGVAALAEPGDMLVVDVGDGFWQAAGTPEMLAHAERVLGARERDAHG